MESPQAPLRYVFRDRAKTVLERKNNQWQSGVGPDAIFAEQSQGWFVYLEGLQIMLHLGDNQPDLSPGDEVWVTLERKT